MTGTSPQAPGFINCTASGMRGAALTGLLPILAPTIRWNEGVMRAVTIVAPEGILCNATWPAPVSSGTISTAWIVQNVVVAALSRLVAFSAEFAKEGPAVTKGHMMVMTLAGEDRDGGPFGTFLLDSTAGGGGAYTDHDGLDGSGDYCVPRPAIANVEANEANGPFLYLYRGFVPDTGGPGRMRGGVGASLAITPYETSGPARDDARPRRRSAEFDRPVRRSSRRLRTQLYPPGRRRHANDRRSRRQSGCDARRSASTNSDRSQVTWPSRPATCLATPSRVAAATAIRSNAIQRPFCATSSTGMSASRPRNRNMASSSRDTPSIRTLRASNATPSAVVRLGGARRSRWARAISSPRRVASPALAAPILDRRPATGKIRPAPTSSLAQDLGRHIRTHAELELREHVCVDCGTLLETEVARKTEASLVTFSLAV